ncbi:MAG TPA: hypothetical protein VND93_26475 [Myxococcales bacterium]|nr:hypothetical protein [Myxococcales bacterium]
MPAAAAAPPFRFAEIAREDVHRHPDAIQRLARGEIDGVVVKGVLPEATRSAVIDRLDRRTPPLRARIVEHVENGAEPPYVLSGGLIASPPDLAGYFADAAHFRAGCRELFRGHPDFEGLMAELIAAMGGGLPAEVPAGPEGQTYSPATVRVLPSTREIALHCGMDFLHRPECAHMRSVVDNAVQLSYFVPVLLPPSGGELELYDVTWGQTDGQRHVNGVPVAFMVALSRRMTAPVGRGDLILFDGGRIYHRVTPVCPGGRRVTIGGFVAYSTDRRRLYYWS